MKSKLLLILIALILNSCLSTKRSSEKETTTNAKETTEVKKDSTSKETINSAIDDKVSINVPTSDTGNQSVDSIVNARVTSILKSINFQKSSGDNSYKFYYDEQLRELRAEIALAETKNKETNTNSSKNVQKTFEERIAERSKKVIKMLPWWVWLIVAWLLRHQIISIISIFVPGVRAIKTVNDLFTPPNKNNS